MIVIGVLGTPAPKGSSRAILIRGRAVNVPGGSNKNRTALKSWDVAVREAAQSYTRDGAPAFVETPVRVSIEFRLARPSSHWGKHGLKPSAPMRPMTKPDIDKLARATVDSLIGIIFDDDSRVVELSLSKVYALAGEEGARIEIGAVRW